MFSPSMEFHCTLPLTVVWNLCHPSSRLLWRLWTWSSTLPLATIWNATDKLNTPTKPWNSTSKSIATNQQNNWPGLLPLAEFTYNNTFNATTGTTPFFSNKGYHPNISVHLEWDLTSPRAWDFVVDLDKHHLQLCDTVRVDVRVDVRVFPEFPLLVNFSIVSPFCLHSCLLIKHPWLVYKGVLVQCLSSAWSLRISAVPGKSLYLS